MKPALVLAVAALGLTATASAQPRGPDRFRAFLQREFQEDRAEPDFRYALAWADLDGDQRPEAVVRLMSRGYCGTGGCTLLVYRASGRSWRRVSRVTVSNAPIRMLATRSHGWRDLGINQRELSGNRFRRYEARLRFDGRTYPLNPSVRPAERLTRPVAGRMLITESDRGRPLF